VAGGDDAVQIDFEKGVVIHEGREYHFPVASRVRS
jgi:hypothetical protein